MDLSPRMFGLEAKRIPIEAEQKYRVPSLAPVARLLEEWGACELPSERQRDTYLQHPSRDFARSGEAFRIRQINDKAVVTYKGPRLPGPVKTRSEIEIPLVDQTEASWQQLLLSLGFDVVAQVVKQRRLFRLEAPASPLTVALDDVHQLGTFVEIEAIIDDPSQLSPIQEQILACARRLEIIEVEPRSYLRQLLEKQKLSSDSTT